MDPRHKLSTEDDLERARADPRQPSGNNASTDNTEDRDQEDDDYDDPPWPVNLTRSNHDADPEITTQHTMVLYRRGSRPEC